MGASTNHLTAACNCLINLSVVCKQNVLKRQVTYSHPSDRIACVRACVHMRYHSQVVEYWPGHNHKVPGLILASTHFFLIPSASEHVSSVRAYGNRYFLAITCVCVCMHACVYI